VVNGGAVNSKKEGWLASVITRSDLTPQTDPKTVARALLLRRHNWQLGASCLPAPTCLLLATRDQPNQALSFSEPCRKISVDCYCSSCFFLFTTIRIVPVRCYGFLYQIFTVINWKTCKINKDRWVEVSFLAGIFLKSGLRPSLEESTLLTNYYHKVLLMLKVLPSSSFL
jgi:hypothetical protein